MNQKQIAERAIRGYQEYQTWKAIADFVDKAEPVEVLRLILKSHRGELRGYRRAEDDFYPKIVFNSGKRSMDALELLLKDRYPGFMVLERLRGGKKDDQRKR